MTNEKEIWQKYCEATRVWFKAIRRTINATLYHLLGKCTHLISAFYIIIAAHTTGDGKIKDRVWKHSMRKACDWVRRTLEVQHRCRVNIDEAYEAIDEGNEAIAKIRELLADVNENIRIVKETAK